MSDITFVVYNSTNGQMLGPSCRSTSTLRSVAKTVFRASRDKASLYYMEAKSQRYNPPGQTHPGALAMAQLWD